MTQHRFRLLAAFAAVYVIWGSTYLAIRFAIETLPPFVMAGARFLLAGAVLYIWARWRGAARPSPVSWIPAFVVGALLLVGGNGGVVWAEQRVPSGLTALLVATQPFWIVLFDWLRPAGSRPSGAVVAGLVFGFIGAGLLVSPSDLVGAGRVDPLGAVVLTIACVSWAAGSLYTARGVRGPGSAILSIGMQMLAGGLLFLVLATLVGEWPRLDPATVSTKSILAFLYLVFFGALIGYSAYIYLLRHTAPARASTYAYVNPVIAVFLGWALGGEPLTGRVVLAMLAIVGAVAMITRHRPASGQDTPPRRGTTHAAEAASAVTPAPPGPAAAPVSPALRARRLPAKT